MGVLSEAEVKKLIGKNQHITTAESDALTLILPMAIGGVQDFLGYMIEQQTITDEYHPIESGDAIAGPEFLDVQGSRTTFQSFYNRNIMQLNHRPVRSITSIYQDPQGYFGQYSGAFPASTLLTAGVDYYLAIESAGISQSGNVHRLSGGWPGIPGSVKVTYVAGYSDGEFTGKQYSAFKEAVWITFEDLWSRFKALLNDMPGGEMSGLSIGGGVSAQFVHRSLGGHIIPDKAAQRLEGYIDYSDWGV